MSNKFFLRTLFVSLLLLTCHFTLYSNVVWAGEIRMTQGQTVYVPAYSNLVVGGIRQDSDLDLSVNLSVRNTDLKTPIRLLKVDYYDSKGKLVRRFLDTPVTLATLGSEYYVILQSDKSGGLGANFIVQWSSTKEVNEPIIEAVTFGTRGAQGFSFVTFGRVIKE